MAVDKNGNRSDPTPPVALRVGPPQVPAPPSPTAKYTATPYPQVVLQFQPAPSGLSVIVERMVQNSHDQDIQIQPSEHLQKMTRQEVNGFVWPAHDGANRYRQHIAVLRNRTLSHRLHLSRGQCRSRQSHDNNFEYRRLNGRVTLKGMWIWIRRLQQRLRPKRNGARIPVAPHIGWPAHLRLRKVNNVLT